MGSAGFYLKGFRMEWVVARKYGEKYIWKYFNKYMKKKKKYV